MADQGFIDRITKSITGTRMSVMQTYALLLGVIGVVQAYALHYTTSDADAKRLDHSTQMTRETQYTTMLVVFGVMAVLLAKLTGTADAIKPLGNAANIGFIALGGFIYLLSQRINYYNNGALHADEVTANMFIELAAIILTAMAVVHFATRAF